MFKECRYYSESKREYCLLAKGHEERHFDYQDLAHLSDVDEETGRSQQARTWFEAKKYVKSQGPYHYPTQHTSRTAKEDSIYLGNGQYQRSED